MSAVHKIRLVVLISGRGSNLQAILDQAASGEWPVEGMIRSWQQFTRWPVTASVTVSFPLSEADDLVPFEEVGGEGNVDGDGHGCGHAPQRTNT